MKLSFEKIHVYTLALMAAILPNIIYLNVIPQPKDSIYFMAFPKGELNYDFFSYGKMMFLIFSTIFLVIMFLWNSYKKLKWHPVYAFLLGYLFFIVASTLFSPFREIAIRGVGDRYEGVFTLLCYLLIFYVGFNVAKDKEDRKILLGGIIIGSLIVGLIGIFQFWGLDIYRTKFMQQIITPSEYGNFNFQFTFGKYTIYSSLYNTNYVGSYMALMLFLGVGLYLVSETKKSKVYSFIYALLMYSNLIGCRSRAGILGVSITTIIVLLIFYKFIRIYKRKLINLSISFVIIFFVMNLVKTEEQGNLTEKFTNYSVTKLDLVDAYIENGALVIIDKFTNIKVFQKDGKVQFYDEENKALLPKIIRSNITREDKNGRKQTFEVNKIVFDNSKYNRFSFDILGQGILDLVYNQGNNVIVRYPIYLIGNTYKSPGITGRVFDIVKIPRWHVLDGYGHLGSNRGYIWAMTVPILKETMFLGYGPDTYSLVFPQNDTFGKTLYFSYNTIVDKPHNMYLQLGVNTGVVSMILFVTALFIFFLDGIVKYRNLESLKIETFLWIGVLAYHATGFFNDSLVSVAPIAWIYFGLSAGLLYNKKDNTIGKALD